MNFIYFDSGLYMSGVWHRMIQKFKDNSRYISAVYAIEKNYEKIINFKILLILVAHQC